MSTVRCRIAEVIEKELRGRGVTLRLRWLEYLARHLEGLSLYPVPRVFSRLAAAGAAADRLKNAMDQTRRDPQAVAAVERLWRAFRYGAPGMYWLRVWSVYVFIRWVPQTSPGYITRSRLRSSFAVASQAAWYTFAMRFGLPTLGVSGRFKINQRPHLLR
jgi:hypothetical protein